MREISIVIAPESKDAITAQVEELRLLPEEVAQRVRVKVLDLLGGLVDKVAVLPCGTAPDTGHYGISIPLPLTAEFIAAARAA